MRVKENSSGHIGHRVDGRGHHRTEPASRPIPQVMVPASVLREMGYSNKEMKEMAFGRYPITELAGSSSYRLTKLRMKIASIEVTKESRGSRAPCRTGSGASPGRECQGQIVG